MPTEKHFDVALVDPHNPIVEHWPRSRVTIEAATVDDLTAEQKAPPAGGESAEGEAKRLAFAVSEIERKRAIASYNELWKLTMSDLRYDVVATDGSSPVDAWSQAWSDYHDHLHGR